MGRHSLFLTLPVILALVTSTFAHAQAQATHPKFIPPAVATAGDISYALNSGVSGVIAVAVALDSSGKIKETEVLRDIPPLTESVLLSINTWTFKPAMLDGKTVESTIVVNIAFNPGDYRLAGGTTPELGKELKFLSPDATGFLPPKVIAVPWAEYPLNSVAQGAVILDCHVSPRGRVTRAAAVWNVPSLTATSIRSARNWTFEPATFNGTHVAANAIIGYVFRPSNIATPLAHP